jgi:hypothetical protein
MDLPFNEWGNSPMVVDFGVPDSSYRLDYYNLLVTGYTLKADWKPIFLKLYKSGF